MENCLQSLKTLNSNVKWAFSDQWVKRWHFFVLINARANGNIFRVKKSNISLTGIFFWLILYWQVILVTCPLLTCDMWNVCLSAQPVGMSLSSSASNTNKNWTFCRFFTKAVNWSKFGFDMFCLIVYTHDKKETFQTSP